jgi:hypothetical protein
MGDYSKVVRRLEEAAATRDLPITKSVLVNAAEAHVLLSHIRWLSREMHEALSNYEDD